MIFSFADIIAYTTSFMTLKAGDVICTGTPVKKAPKVDPPVWLKPGDTIEVEMPARSACCAITWRMRRDDERPRRLRHRLADRTFALAADP